MLKYFLKNCDGDRYFVNLTDAQVALLEWLEDLGFLDRDAEYEALTDDFFETI